MLRLRRIISKINGNKVVANVFFTLIIYFGGCVHVIWMYPVNFFY